MQEDQQVRGPSLQLFYAVEMRALAVRHLENDRHREMVVWKKRYRQKVGRDIQRKGGARRETEREGEDERHSQTDRMRQGDRHTDGEKERRRETHRRALRYKESETEREETERPSRKWDRRNTGPS